MKIAAMPLAGAFSLVGGLALGQGGDDPMAHLRACSLMEGPARLECLDIHHVTLHHLLAPPRRPTIGSSARPGRLWITRQLSSLLHCLATA